MAKERKIGCQRNGYQFRLPMEHYSEGPGCIGALGVATHEALPEGATGTFEEATQKGESYSKGQTPKCPSSSKMKTG